MDIKFFLYRIRRDFPQHRVLHRVIADMLNEDDPLRYLSDVLICEPEIAIISNEYAMFIYSQHEAEVEEIFFSAQQTRGVLMPEEKRTLVERRTWMTKFAYVEMAWFIGEQLEDAGIQLPM